MDQGKMLSYYKALWKVKPKDYFFKKMYSNISNKKRYLFESPSQIDNFNLKTSVVTCFIQHQHDILVLKRSGKENHSFIWGTPGGEIDPKKDHNEDAALIREVFEETGIRLKKENLKFVAKRYSRVPGWDYILYLYHLKLEERPEIKLSEEHVEAKWEHISKFKSLELLTTQDESFDIIFGDSIWQSELCREKLMFVKRDKLLEFDNSKRLIISLIGNSGVGKGTQAGILRDVYKIPHISAGDLFRKELRKKGMVDKLITYYNSLCPSSYVPDELFLGIINKRLACEDCQRGFILDGFPRNREQAIVFTKLLMRPQDIHIPIFMSLNESVLKNRLQNRFICPECGCQVRNHDLCQAKYCPQPSCKNVILEHRKEDINENELNVKFSLFNSNIEDIIKTIEKRDRVNYLSLTEKETYKDVFDSINSLLYKKLDEIYVDQRNLKMKY